MNVGRRTLWGIWCLGEGWCPAMAPVLLFESPSKAATEKTRWEAENPMSRYEVRVVVVGDDGLSGREEQSLEGRLESEYARGRDDAKRLDQAYVDAQDRATAKLQMRLDNIVAFAKRNAERALVAYQSVPKVATSPRGEGSLSGSLHEANKMLGFVKGEIELLEREVKRVSKLDKEG